MGYITLLRIVAGLAKKLRDKKKKKVSWRWSTKEENRKGRRTDQYGHDESVNVEYGDGVWKKEILMGEKCQPLDFSGVIYYDTEGRKLSEIPRSPMRNPGGRSPLPSFVYRQEIQK